VESIDHSWIGVFVAIPKSMPCKALPECSLDLKEFNIFIDSHPGSGYMQKLSRLKRFLSMESKHLIDKALSYIEVHLKEEMLLEDIATVANYSAWHFHRVFYAIIGLTVG
jgi:hypothetical protein